MKESDFLTQLRVMQRSEGGGGGRDPVRTFVWWVIKTIAWLCLWLVITSITVVSCLGAYMGSTKIASLFGIVLIILFVLSHFMWMGKKN